MNYKVLTVFFATIAVAACATINDINNDDVTITEHEQNVLASTTELMELSSTSTDPSTSTPLSEDRKAILSCIEKFSNRKSDDTMEISLDAPTRTSLDDLFNVLQCNMTVKIEKFEATGKITENNNKEIVWTQNFTSKNFLMNVEITTETGSKKNYILTGENCEFSSLYKLVMADENNLSLVTHEDFYSPKCDRQTMPDSQPTVWELWAIMRFFEHTLKDTTKLLEQTLLKCVNDAQSKTLFTNSQDI